jgi:hypothetical protein
VTVRGDRCDMRPVELLEAEVMRDVIGSAGIARSVFQVFILCSKFTHSIGRSLTSDGLFPPFPRVHLVVTSWNAWRAK